MSDYVARVTSKGQLTIPAAVRRRLGINEGDSIKITINDDSAVMEKVTQTVASVRGVVPALPGVDVGDFDDLIEDAMSRHVDWLANQERGVPE